MKNQFHTLCIAAGLLLAGALAAVPAIARALDGAVMDGMAGIYTPRCPAADHQTVDAQVAPEFMGGGGVLHL